MRFWLWNAGLGAEALREQVLQGVLATGNARAAGPQCSLFAEVHQCERRAGLDRRQADQGHPQERRQGSDRRLYGSMLQR